jgi:hypothetical protein
VRKLRTDEAAPQREGISTVQMLLLLLAVAATEPEPLIDIARLDSGQAKKVEVVRQEATNKGTELTIVLNPKDEQFSVDFDWDATDFRKVTVLVKGAKAWDTVRYFPTVKSGGTSRNTIFFDLMKTRGVIVDKSGNDCSIEFRTANSLKLLPPGGRLIFRFASGAALHLNSGAPPVKKAAPKSTDE